MAEYQVLARRYRPQTFAEVFGQSAIVTTLKNAIIHKRLAHAYLFCGSRGTGKTTLARVFAKALNCQTPREDLEPCNSCTSCLEIASGSSLDVLEIDGASHRGIDDIRQINETVGYAAAAGGYKIYIIDEVHMLTKEAFNALLKTLEEPPSRVKFFFATTEPHKVPTTILSRCQRFNLNRIPLEMILKKLTFIAEQQQVDISEGALRLIAARAEGGMRDAESILDQIFAFHEGSVTEESVANVLGIVQRELFFTLDNAVKEANMAIAFELAHQIFSQGKDIVHFVESLTEHFRTLLLIKIADQNAPFLTLSPEDRSKYALSAKIYTQEQCLTILDFLVEALGQIRFMPSGRIALEALLLRILRIHQRVPVDFLVKQLTDLEQSVKLAASQDLGASHTANPKISTEIKPPFPPQKVEAKPEHNPITAETPKAPPPPSLSMTIDPTPTPQELGLKAAPPLKQEISVLQPPSGDALQAPPGLRPRLSQEEQAEASKKQSRYDTILQFAAVELEGSLQKTAIKGF